eukprot:EG_transcript_25244
MVKALQGLGHLAVWPEAETRPLEAVAERLAEPQLMGGLGLCAVSWAVSALGRQNLHGKSLLTAAANHTVTGGLLEGGAAPDVARLLWGFAAARHVDPPLVQAVASWLADDGAAIARWAGPDVAALAAALFALAPSRPALFDAVAARCLAAGAVASFPGPAVASLAVTFARLRGRHSRPVLEAIGTAVGHRRVKLSFGNFADVAWALVRAGVPGDAALATAAAHLSPRRARWPRWGAALVRLLWALAKA